MEAMGNPRAARVKAVYRWYLFPHSFTGDLVHALIDEWKLDEHDRILDPFAGAGTTLLAAKERGILGVGLRSISLAILISKVKITSFTIDQLESTWHVLKRIMMEKRIPSLSRDYPELVCKALPQWSTRSV